MLSQKTEMIGSLTTGSSMIKTVKWCVLLSAFIFLLGCLCWLFDCLVIRID